MGDDIYDILPHKQVEQFREEISKLKSGTAPQQPALENSQLANSMTGLAQSINSLMALFNQAYSELKMEEHDSLLLADRIGPMQDKLDRVLEQNEKIAKGIVAIADMVEELQRSVRALQQDGAVSREAPVSMPPMAPPMRQQSQFPSSFGSDMGSPAPMPMPMAPVPTSPFSSAPPQPGGMSQSPFGSPKPLPTMPSPPPQEEKKKEPLFRFK